MNFIKVVHNIFKQYVYYKHYKMILNIDEKINNNNTLSELFNNQNVSKLIKLYQESQIENQRNKRLTPEVGTSREKDLIAYFIHIIKDTHKINYKII